jgi:hypothetical protein
MPPKPDEVLIEGQWLEEGGHVRVDATEQRIRGLVDGYLVKLGADRSGWDRLYRDPARVRLTPRCSGLACARR